MKYAELDEATQKKAYEKWYPNEPYDEWWDSTYNDAVAVGLLMGIDIGEERMQNSMGRACTKIDISFSGFWSQGDGCCWGGYLRVQAMAGAVEKVKAYASQDEKLHRLALVAEGVHAMVCATQMKDALSDGDPDFPECEPGMSIKVDGDSHHGFSTKVDDNDIPHEVYLECKALASDFADWIYNQLEAEHDHLTSEESFAEYVEANDPDFDEDGNLE